MSLDDYMSSEYSSSRQIARPTLRKILEVIASKKATYPSEIVKESRVDKETVNQTLYDLKKAEVITSLKPSMKNSDQRLLDRRGDMWARGITGINPHTGQFNKQSWYGLNKRFDWLLYDSERDMYVDEYHRPIDKDKDDLVKTGLTYAVERIENID